MRIKMLKTSAGPHGAYFAGRTYDMPDRQAKPLLKAQAAEVVRTAESATSVKEDPAETTSVDPPENAAQPQPGKVAGGGATKADSPRKPK